MKIILAICFIFLAISSPCQDVLISADELLLNSDYEKVIALVDGSNALPENERWKLENKKAEALIRLGKLEDARKILQPLLQNSSGVSAAVTLSNLGLLHIYEGRNDLALETLQKSLQTFNALQQSNSLQAAQAMAYLGQVYKFTGKATQAEEQLRMALSIRESLLKGEHELIAASYNDLGLAYVEVDNDKALDFYEKALKLYQKLHGDEHAKIALLNSNMGVVYREMKLYGDAVNNFETTLKIWEKISTGANPAKAFALHNLGQTYSQMGNEDAARGYYDRALEMYRESYGTKHPDIAQVLNDLGFLELNANNFDAAIRNFQQAISANVKSFQSDDPLLNPKLDEYYNGQVLLYSMLLKARAFESRHFGKTLKLSDLTTALTVLEKCDSLIDKLRQQSTNESDKIALGVIATEVYADGVRTAMEAASGALKKKRFYEKVFYFAEKSKSAVLLEAISDSNAKSFAGIPANLLEEEKNLKSAIALTAQKLAQKPTPEEEKYLRETSFALNRAYETFIANLEKEYPSYFNLKYNAASPSIAQIKGLLDKNSAILSYFIDEANQRLYIFQITKSKLKVIDHPLEKDFDKNITGFRNGIYFNVSNAYAKASNALSPVLLPKIPSSIKHLTILPTGRLGIIPFEALSTKKIRTSESFNEADFLIRKRSVSYEFSAGLMLQKQKVSQAKKQSILLCAPITFDSQDNLTDLPGTESEVKAISDLFKAKEMQAQLYTGSQANEQTIKSTSLKDFNVIHFATHGVVDESSPELSRIFLQRTSDAEDGNLFAGEIYNLQMDADLVTLSACQTGLGKISKGEGVIGLSRALVYAGAKSIVVSFWSVADESTSELMKSFYQQMLQRQTDDYAACLREAKLNLMKNDKYRAPFFWAPFILIGF